MTLKWVTRALIFTLFLTTVFSGRYGRGNGGSQGGRGNGDSQTYTEPETETETSSDPDPQTYTDTDPKTYTNGYGNGGGRRGNGGGQGGKGKGGKRPPKGFSSEDTEETPTDIQTPTDTDTDTDTQTETETYTRTYDDNYCYLGRTGDFYPGAQEYLTPGPCGCRFPGTRNALRELAAGYLIEFNRHLVEYYGVNPNTYEQGRFEDWFFEFATNDVIYRTSTGTDTTQFNNLGQLTNENSGFGYQLATGDLDYRVEISPTVMVECSADGTRAELEGLVTIYRIDRDDECTTGFHQARSRYVFRYFDDNQYTRTWLVSRLRFDRRDIPETCD